ncbi:MAG TPA: BrxA family protein [Pirellulales bacterium]|nr:BrxA family protein [Pirellulales bacterium]
MIKAITVGDDRRYTIRTSKGTAMLAETRVLLRAWEPPETATALAEKALARDVLAKSTARRAKDVVRRVFAPRFLEAPGCPAARLKRLLDRAPNGDWFRDICLIYTARADFLVRDAITVLLRRAALEGRCSLGVETVIAFLDEAEHAGRMQKPWSREVKRKVARGLLKMLTEFGFLAPAARGPREIIRFRPSRLAIAYLAFDLHFAGHTDAALVAHGDWRLWLLDESQVRAALDELSRPGSWFFQAAGSVVRIGWGPSTMEEALDVLARLDV